MAHEQNLQKLQSKGREKHIFAKEFQRMKPLFPRTKHLRIF